MLDGTHHEEVWAIVLKRNRRHSPLITTCPNLPLFILLPFPSLPHPLPRLPKNASNVHMVHHADINTLDTIVRDTLRHLLDFPMEETELLTFVWSQPHCKGWRMGTACFLSRWVVTLSYHLDVNTLDTIVSSFISKRTFLRYTCCCMRRVKLLHRKATVLVGSRNTLSPCHAFDITPNTSMHLWIHNQGFFC